MRIGLRRVELPQQHLAVCPRQVEDAIRHAPILIFLDQRQTNVACLSDAGNNIDCCRFIRIECYLTADCSNRIKHGSLAARESPDAGQRPRIGDSISPAYELHPIGFIGDFSPPSSMNGH